ncbi:hypothetical protein KA977_12035 [Candidatus Dependentiae bacterium]|nr:hypothetical protein [Candidatus Dependentiae bacterium]
MNDFDKNSNKKINPLGLIISIAGVGCFLYEFISRSKMSSRISDMGFSSSTASELTRMIINDSDFGFVNFYLVGIILVIAGLFLIRSKK